MAVINTNLVCDLQKAVKVEYIDGVLFSQDNQANQINVTVLDGGEPATISGTVSANIIRSDGGTVAASGGSITGNVASITLPAAAYAVPGVVSIVVKLTTSGVITTIAAIVGNMYRSSTDTAIDPGTIIPSIQTLISQINAAVASIPADYSSLWTKLAPAFSTDASYVAGQYVTYNSGLYRFNTTHTGGWSSSDVTAVNLGGEITDLKSAFTNEFNAVNSSLYGAGNAIPVNATSNNYRLTGDGKCISNSSYKMSKYYLTSYISAGSIILINSDDCFQFQTDAGVSTTSATNLVGLPYNGAGLYAVKVPAGATWLIVSTPQSGSVASVYVATDKVAKLNTDLSTEVTNRGNEDTAIKTQETESSKEISNGLNPYLDEVLCLPGLFEIGDLGFSGGLNYNPSSTKMQYRIRTKEGFLFPLKAGDVIKLTDYSNARFMVGFYRTDSTYAHSGDWITSGEYVCPSDGTYAILLANPDGSETIKTNVYSLQGLLQIIKADARIKVSEERLDELNPFYFTQSEFEIGDLGTSGGWNYNPSSTKMDKRVRTKEGVSFPLKAGDIIYLTDYSNARFFVGFRRPNGSYWNSGDWITEGEYRCPYNGDYVLLLAEPNGEETTQTSTTALYSVLRIISGIKREVITLSEQRLKVCSYNIGQYAYGGTQSVSADAVEHTKKFICKHGFDVLALQESPQTVNGVNMATDVYGYIYPYDLNGGTGNDANCIKSMYPLVEKGLLNETDHGWQYASINVGTKQVVIISLHFGAFSGDWDEDFPYLTEFLADCGSFICMGDFNFANTSYSDANAQAKIDQFKALGYRVASGGFQGLIHTNQPNDLPVGTGQKALDNIITSPDIRIVNAYNLFDEFSELDSDHIPLVAELLITMD